VKRVLRTSGQGRQEGNNSFTRDLGGLQEPSIHKGRLEKKENAQKDQKGSKKRGEEGVKRRGNCERGTIRRKRACDPSFQEARGGERKRRGKDQKD